MKIVKRVKTISLLFCGFLALCMNFTVSAQDAPSAKPASRDFIIDTDMDFDDWFSILYLLNQSTIQVKGISLEATGTTSCDHSVNNALSVIALAGKSGIPVSCGGNITLSGDPLIVIPDYRDDINQMFGIELQKSDEKPYSKDAEGLLHDLLSNAKEPMEIITLGPMTNLAKTFRKYPELKKQVKMFYIMGGALDIDGNVNSSNPALVNKTAEWNFYADVAATNDILNSGIPITLITLDAADEVPITPEFYRTLQDKQMNQKARFVYDVISIISGRSSAYYFWDPLAAVIATHPDIAKIQKMKVKLITERGPDYGRLVIAKDGISMNVCTTLNKDAFYQNFLEGITQ